MKTSLKSSKSVAGLLLALAFCLAALNFQIADAQDAPLTYPQIITALGSRVPNQTFKTRKDVVDFLIRQVQQRRVDKPLTTSREDDLRQAGATDELIAAIRANSPPLPMPKPLATPTPTPIRTQTPTATPSPTPFNLRPLSELLKTAPKAGEIRKNSIGMELVWIPRGEFMMGSTELEVEDAHFECKKYYSQCRRDGFTNEMPKRKVTITAGFWMGRYEVSQAQWQTVMETSPSYFRLCGVNCPVEQVSWDDIQIFIQRMNAKNDGYEYGLPSEAQWEYAARAGTTTVFAFGDELDSSRANFNGQFPYVSKKIGENLGKTTPVGRYLANGWGLYDMHGNVWEWCEDRYASYTAGAEPKPPGDFRVIRGGSWISFANLTRSASRAWYSQSNSNYDIGFRVVARPK